MNKKVVIAGCTKNSATYINEHLQKLVSVGELFETYSIIIYENDSSDNTLEILSKFKKNNNNFNFVSEKNVINKIKYPNINNRVQIICHGRNILLKIIKQYYFNYDLMIMIDLDNVLEKFNPNTILNILKYNEEWSALTANCFGKYYDIWALRIPSNVWNIHIHNKIWNNPIDHDCWSQIINNTHPRILIESYQKIIPIDMSLIKTESSFGGLGIYKISKILNSNYDCYTYDKNGNLLFIQCEHVSFNKSIEGPKYICPSLLVLSPKEHIINY